MYRMIVDKGDWDELVATVVDKDKQIEKYRKTLENLCTEFRLVIGSSSATDSDAYKEAIKII